ncbi:amidohydrolase family protein [Rhizobium sullae]|uniref:amidohydrolase family protein n=1 Tax=Rhizobium sullae TaxID=50338 RepID=UPI001FCD7A79|nr:amidohydrolase family protein [Rhizobium sullae]
MPHESAVTLFRGVSVYDPSVEAAMRGPLDVLIEAGRITRIAKTIEPPPGARQIAGIQHLLMPGLVNGHFHSSVNHMKGRLPGLPLEIFMLYESPALDVLMPTPREAYLRTMLAAIEMLKSGTTAVQDDAFFVPQPTTEIIDAVCQAYADCGIRATVALDEPQVPELEKLPFLADLVPPHILDELSRSPALGREDLLGLYDHLITKWHGHANGRIRAAVSCSAPQRVTTDYFHTLDELSRDHQIPFYAHMLETKLQRVLGIEKYGGRSLIRYVHDLGLLSERMNIIHAIWVDDADLDLIAASGAAVAHNPISNLRLGSGVMPFRRMRERNIPICLGVDEAIADDAVNMWSVIKTAGMIHNLSEADYRRWPQAAEIMDCAIEGGARAMGMQGKLGRVDVGQIADLILIDLRSMAFSPLNDLQRQLVHCEDGRSVAMTMVDGQIVAERGTTTLVNEADILAEAREIFSRKAPALADAAAAMNRLLPFYDEMYFKAAAVDVGMNRKLGETRSS